MSGYDLAEALRLWLAKQKIEGEDRTQSKVARSLGITAERLHHWLTGRNRIPLNNLITVARYFHFADDAALIAEVRRLYPARAVDPSTRAHVEASLERLASVGTAAKTPRPPRQPAQPVTARRTHGKPRAV